MDKLSLELKHVYKGILTKCVYLEGERMNQKGLSTSHWDRLFAISDIEKLAHEEFAEIYMSGIGMV